MAKKEVFAPFFVVSVDEHDQASIQGACAHLNQQSAEEAAATGVGTTNYVVGTLVEFDRTSLDASEIAGECAKLMMEITSNRHTSSPQCIPVAMYKQMAKLAQQYKAAIITSEQK